MIPFAGLIKVGINAVQVIKVIKGGGVAAGGAAIFVALRTAGILPDLGEEGAALITAALGVGLNFLRKLLLRYDIDIAVKKA